MSNYFSAISLLSVGMIAVLLGVSLKYGEVEPNPWVGFRFREAFKTPEHWRRINQHGAMMFTRWGLVALALGVFFFSCQMPASSGPAASSQPFFLSRFLCRYSPRVALRKILVQRLRKLA